MNIIGHPDYFQPLWYLASILFCVNFGYARSFSQYGKPSIVGTLFASRGLRLNEDQRNCDSLSLYSHFRSRSIFGLDINFWCVYWAEPRNCLKIAQSKIHIVCYISKNELLLWHHLHTLQLYPDPISGAWMLFFVALFAWFVKY